MKNYEIVINSGVYTVNKRDLNITVSKSHNDPVVYGGDHPVITAAWAISLAEPWDIADVDADGADATIAVAGVLTTGASLNIPAANAGVDTYAVVASGAAGYGDNFTINYDGGVAFDVVAADLTLTATDRSKITGATWPELAYTFDATDLKFGDTLAAAVVLGDPVLELAAVGGLDPASDGTSAAVGVYNDAIVFGAGITSDNYNVITVPADLTVTLVPATLVWAPVSTELTYGDAWTADHFNADTTTEIDGVKITGDWAYSVGGAGVGIGDNPNAGSITVDATFTPNGGAAGIFDVNTISYTFAVAKATLAVTANDQNRSFGDDLPVYDAGDYTITEGFVLGQDAAVIDTPPGIIDPTAKTSNVGDYTLSVGGGADDNYDFAYTTGTLTIAAAATTVTWDPPAIAPAEAITYGTALATTTSFNAAAPEGVEGTLVYSIATDNEYALTVPGVDVSVVFKPSSDNYADSAAVTRTLIVDPLEVEVAPDAVEVVFGDAIPALTGTTGFRADDGIVANFTTTATDSSSVGTYFITVNYEDSAGRLSNYDVNLKSTDDNRVTIVPAVANVEVLNGSSVVNDTDLDDIAEVNATLQVKFTGLKAEAAVLNGVALTAAQIGEAVANNTLPSVPAMTQ